MKKKKANISQLIFFLCFLVLGGICGFVIADSMDTLLFSEDGLNLSLFFVMILLLYAVMFLQIIIHELGHMVFGLLTGYRFSSFRIGSFMWMKKGGKIEFKRMSLAGTGGQCLMTPPDMTDGRMPYILYNLGGSILNILTALIFLILTLLFDSSPVFLAIARMGALFGLGFALMNGIPMRLGTVDNDGNNALSLGKDPKAMRALWVQLKISQLQTEGVRLKDMPEDWFALPDDEDMGNSMIAALGVFACGRLMDEHRFPEADRLMAKYLYSCKGMVGIYKGLMTCDRLYCQCMVEHSPEIMDYLLSKEQKKLMKAMKNSPSVMRTEAVMALIHENDPHKAHRLLEKFNKLTASYPYTGDIENEKELIALAFEKMNKQ